MEVDWLNYAVKTAQNKLSSFDLARPRGAFVGTGPGSSGDFGRPPTGKLGYSTGKVMAQFGTL